MMLTIVFSGLISIQAEDILDAVTITFNSGKEVDWDGFIFSHCSSLEINDLNVFEDDTYYSSLVELYEGECIINECNFHTTTSNIFELKKPNASIVINNGTYISDHESKCVINNDNGGSITLNDGIYTSNKSIVKQNDTAITTINAGTFTLTNPSDDKCMLMNGTFYVKGRTRIY